MKKSAFNFKKFLVLPVLAAGMILASCNKDDEDEMPQPQPMQKDIVEIAAGDAQLSILVEAVTKAGLVSALKGDGPMTVFAPTNDAFNDLFAALGVGGINDLPADVLEPILLYHVLGIEAKASSLNSGYVQTLNTTAPDDNSVSLLVEVSKGVMLNGNTNVTTADIDASNGVIHVIDAVLLPPTVVDLAIANSNFSTLVAAVVKANLVDALNGDGPFTVFAPTNAAFDALFADLGVSGIDDLTADQLTPILLYHVVSANVRSDQVSTGSVPSLNGANIDIVVDNMGVTLNGTAKVVAVDVQGTNGVIHAIDQVILPPTK
jgi:transforming growth factor-beta-induced protein